MAFLAATRVLGPALDGTYHLALPIVPSHLRAHVLLRFIAVASLSSSALIALILLGVSVLVPSANLTALAWLGIPFVSLLTSAVAWTTQARIRERAYGVIAAATLAQSVALSLALLALGFLLGTATAVVASHAIGALAAFCILRRRIPYGQNSGHLRVSRLKTYAVLKRYARFPSITLPTVVLNSLSTNLAVIVLSSTAGSAGAGLFSLAERLALAPVTLVGSAMASVYVGEMSAAIRDAPHRITSVFRYALATSGSLGLATYFAVSIAGPPIVGWLLPASWSDAIPLLQPFALISALRLIAVAVSRVFTVLERQNIALVWNVARLVSSLGALLIPYSLGFDLLSIVWVYAITSAISDLCIVALAGWVVAGEASRRGGTP